MCNWEGPGKESMSLFHAASSGSESLSNSTHISGKWVFTVDWQLHLPSLLVGLPIMTEPHCIMEAGSQQCFGRCGVEAANRPTS